MDAAHPAGPTPPDADEAERLAAILAGSPATTAVAVTTEPVTVETWTLPVAPGTVPLHTTGRALTVQRLDDGSARSQMRELAAR